MRTCIGCKQHRDCNSLFTYKYDVVRSKGLLMTSLSLANWMKGIDGLIPARVMLPAQHQKQIHGTLYFRCNDHGSSY